MLKRIIMIMLKKSVEKKKIDKNNENEIPQEEGN